MTANLATHPDRQQLVDFGLGKLDADSASQIEEHLGGCRTCCDTLLNLQDDTFTSLVRKAESASSAADTNGALAESSLDAKTVLVQSGESLPPAELPAELVNHPRYHITELIGQGGMGHVYRARHKLMNRSVALKVISSHLVQNAQAVERFRREVQAAAQLVHPNIVTAYDAEQAGGVHFLVMEFVEGTDLATVVQQRGPLSIAEACDCIRQSARGLQRAHEKGMVHRDIKPHNLMMSPDGQVRILDFGLAGIAAESALMEAAATPGSHASLHLTAIGSVMGTPDYIAPEQARNAHAADIRADIYSLGCTLCFLLTGRPPFAADSVLDKLKAHVHEAPPALETLRNDVPPELSAIVRRMLAKNPADRFQTPAEVVAALTPFVIGGRAPARQKSKTPLWQVIAASVAAVGLFVAFGAAVVVATDRGRLVINSEVDDVKVQVTSGGQEVAVIDAKTGSQVRWLPTGTYEVKLVGDDSAVKLNQTGFQMSRLGRVIVTAKWNTANAGVIRSFGPDDETIARDGVTPANGGWKITATSPRSVPLFEVKDLNFAKGPFFYRAQLKTENVQGRAFLEMWVRFPGQGEFFSKGFNHALSGTNGWAEYEIPFLLKEGEHPDQVRLNVNIEGSGTVWIKDPQVLGRNEVAPETSEKKLAPATDPGVDVRRSALAEVALVQQSITARGNVLPVVLFEQRGKTAFRFGRWLLIFEGVPCNSGSSGLLGLSALNYPLKGGRGEGDLDFGTGLKDFGILIHQKWDDHVNEVSVNNFRFNLFDEGTRLEFGEQSFRATPELQTISIGRDGTAQLQAAPAKSKTEQADADARRIESAEVELIRHSTGPADRVLAVVLVQQRGNVAFRFGRWLVILDGLPSENDRIGTMGFIQIGLSRDGKSGEDDMAYPRSAGRAAIFIHHKWDGEGNELTVNKDYRFKICDAGARLEIGDQIFHAGSELQTIVLAGNGSARLETAAE